MNPEIPYRGLSLGLILLVTLSPAILVSTYYFINDTGTTPSDASMATSIIWELLSLGLLAVALRKQGRSFKEIGFVWRASDLLHAPLIYGAYYAIMLVAVLWM